MIGTMEIIMDKAVDEMNFEIFAKRWMDETEEIYSKLDRDCFIMRNGDYLTLCDQYTGFPFVSGINLRALYYESNK